MATQPLPECDLIAQHVVADPNRGSEPKARLRERGVEIWSLVGYWQAVNHDEAQVAADFALSPEAVRAALAYYRLHRPAIDAQLMVNSA